MNIACLRYKTGLGKYIYEWSRKNNHRVLGFGNENGFNLLNDRSLFTIANMAFGSTLFFNYGHISKSQQVKMIEYWYNLNYDFKHYCINFYNIETDSSNLLKSTIDKINNSGSSCKCITINTGIDPCEFFDHEAPDYKLFNEIKNKDNVIDYEKVMLDVVNLIIQYETTD